MTPNVSLPMYDLSEMRADNARFGEALRGLLRAHDWGLITVEFSEREDGIWLSVEDTGIGMSEAVLTRFWGTTRMVEGFPGLAAKGMVSARSGLVSAFSPCSCI